MTLEEQIKYYRKQAGLSQEKMAEIIGVSRQAVTKWENGTGVPDIANLMALSDYFQISVDELLSNGQHEKKQTDYLYQSHTEYDIDGKKNYDIHLGGARTVKIGITDEEKLKVSLLSNAIKDLSSDYKIRIDDDKRRIDVDMQRLNGASEAAAKEGLTVSILLPDKYIGKIELAVNAGKVELCDIENEICEINGKISMVVLQRTRGEVEIDSNLDMQVDVISHTGSLEINQISATSRVTVPVDYNFRAAAKGIAAKIFFEKHGKRVDDFSNPEANNYIEFNGMKSELVIAAEDV